MSTIVVAARRRLRFDPGLLNLRAAAVLMAGVLASFGSALLLERLAGLHADVVVLAVALSVPLGRARPGGALRRRLVSYLLLPVVALGASRVGMLMVQHAALGDVLFAAVVSGSIWVRRFGPWAARAGTLVALPFLAMLVVPVPLTPGDARSLWTAVIALIAVGCAGLARFVAERTGVVPRVAATDMAPATAPAAAPARPGRRFAASTRMAAQMGVALGGAFVVGHLAFGHHWPWVVLTAFIVSSGNRGRGDVVYKAALRLVGAVGGTVCATLLAGTFPPGDKRAIVAIFLVLAVGSWLRAVSYAYWAACVSAMLAFLYGFIGEAGSSLLAGRLLGIVVGAVIAVAAAWLVLPVRSIDVLRRRTADALGALADVLRASRGDPADLGRQRARFDQAVRLLDQIAPPLLARRWLARRWRAGPHPADLITGVRRCAGPVAAIARLGTADPAALGRPDVAGLGVQVALQVGAVRRTLGRRPDAPAPAPDPPGPIDGDELGRAFADLAAAVADLHIAAAGTVPARPVAAAAGRVPASRAD
jgi:hypothetical protein